jgi:alginate O-acetyltransferase complex protein AlgI
MLGFDPGILSNIFMPLGISFFTFEYIHYLIDLNADKLPSHTASDFFTFAFFFPTLASGPIKRFQAFVLGINDVKNFSNQFILSGLFLILVGYLEKYLIADNLVSRTAFLAYPAVAPSATALLSGLFIYSFRLFFDFAGLSNIAIGSALFFGIKVPINFDRPFFKTDLALFWRSWHMSLTSWIRDYVYMPLVFHYRNAKSMIFIGLIVTMGLVGLWHGSSWNFLFFGLYHGFGLAALQIYRGFQPKRLIPKPIAGVIGMFITFIYVSFGWGFFVTHNLSDSMLIYRSIFAKLL